MSVSQARNAAAIVVFLTLKEMEERKTKQTKRRKKRVWVRDWIAKRETDGFFANLLGELRSEDPAVYRNFIRMSAIDFDMLLSLISPQIAKQDTLMRKSISAAERLAITLRYLATGESFHSLMNVFRVPVCTISKIIPEVCSAIYSTLESEYLQTPTTTQRWKEIANLFEKQWNFPNCIGALDGKHVVIRALPHGGSAYFNYKKCYSIILMALVDAEYKFTYIDVGSNKKNTDGEVFTGCSLVKALEEGTLNVPPDQPMPNGLQHVPHVIVADERFAMRRYIMTPYPQINLQGPERIFNYRLLQAQRISENVFGIISARFRVLCESIELSPQKATTVVLAICALHNFLMTHACSRKIYATNVDFDRECEAGVIIGQWRNEENYLNGTSLLSLQPVNNQSSNEFNETREVFKNYFMTDGEVLWQYKHL